MWLGVDPRTFREMRPAFFCRVRCISGGKPRAFSGDSSLAIMVSTMRATSPIPQPSIFPVTPRFPIITIRIDKTPRAQITSHSTSTFTVHIITVSLDSIHLGEVLCKPVGTREDTRSRGRGICDRTITRIWFTRIWFNRICARSELAPVLAERSNFPRPQRAMTRWGYST